MSETTKTMSCRVASSVAEEVDAAAMANGQSVSDWMRETMMQRLLAENPRTRPDQEATQAGTLPDASLAAIERRTPVGNPALVNAFKTALAELAKTQTSELRTMAQLILDLDEFIGDRIDGATDAILDRLDRLKQSQRSHKDTVLQAIAAHQRPDPRRY